jgi:hypothetical protein
MPKKDLSKPSKEEVLHAGIDTGKERTENATDEWFRKLEICDVATTIRYKDPTTAETVVLELKGRVIPGASKHAISERATIEKDGETEFDIETFHDEILKATFDWNDEQVQLIKTNKPVGVYDALVMAAMRLSSIVLPKKKAEAIKN